LDSSSRSGSPSTASSSWAFRQDELRPEVSAVTSEVSSRSWQFIERDPVLSGHDRDVLQAELARHISKILRTGYAPGTRSAAFCEPSHQQAPRGYARGRALALDLAWLHEPARAVLRIAPSS
jgi:hypothetical protein